MPVQRLDVAVMFADIVDFTRRAETLQPEAALALLRCFHCIAAQMVHRHGGRLDVFLGDGLMATFGNPDPSRCDAANAVVCAKALADAVDEWNAQSGDEEPIRVGIGVHYGAVAVGHVGDAQQHHHSVFGDVVNVASRLQRLTRPLGTTIVASDAVVSRAARSLHLAPHGWVHLPGRKAPVEVWVTPAQASRRFEECSEDAGGPVMMSGPDSVEMDRGAA